MVLPFKYNLRNLVVRRTTTLMTALSITLTVAVFLTLMALAQGLQSSLAVTGSPLNVLILGRGAQSEGVSVISRDLLNTIQYLHGIASDPDGTPRVSPELVELIHLRERGGHRRANVTVRGVTMEAPLLRPKFRIVAGHMFRSGLRQVVVGRRIVDRFRDCALGDKLKFGHGYWKVVGIFTAGNSAYSSEIWTGVNELGQAFERDNYSDVIVRARNAGAVAGLEHEITSDRRLRLKAETERAYYASQTQTAGSIRIFGLFITVLMAIGASFAAMNTMYAAVARRTREIGTLRALGFSRASILIAFMAESVLIALVGGVLGCLVALPVGNITTGTTNLVTFSEVAFNLRVTPELMALALAFSALMGLLGGFLPAWHASRESIVAALRSA